jgi:hypothetical protein
MCDEEKERTTNILARHHQGLRVHGSALHLRVRVDNEHGPQAGNRGGRRRVHAGELDVTFEAARRGRQRCMLDTCTGCDYDNTGAAGCTVLGSIQVDILNFCIGLMAMFLFEHDDVLPWTCLLWS